MDVNWSQTFETVLDMSSTELDRSSTLPLTPEIDLATGFGVTNR